MRLVKRWGFKSKAFSELIGDEFKELHGRWPSKTEMQKYGTQRRDEKGSWYWVTVMAAWARQHGRVVIPGVRFPQEVEWIQRQHHWCLMRVDSKRGDTFARDPHHICEHALDQFDGWNYIVSNDGSLDSLHESIDGCLLDWAEVEAGVRARASNPAQEPAAAA